MANRSDRKFYVYIETIEYGTTIGPEMGGYEAEAVFDMIRRSADKTKVSSVGLCELTLEGDEDRLVGEEQFYAERDFTEYRFAGLWSHDAVEIGGGARRTS